ncbi:MAG: 3-isopropylmalate dehydrogenase, partial [Magnetococcales bacterium]|nr:3-isopropylmalate dehydrogenase [Magnetococcales bacterium]
SQIENAVSRVLDQGLRTADIMDKGSTLIGCAAMGDAVVAALEKG